MSLYSSLISSISDWKMSGKTKTGGDSSSKQVTLPDLSKLQQDDKVLHNFDFFNVHYLINRLL